jgi:trehalose 6-phosphate phosphatase
MLNQLSHPITEELETKLAPLREHPERSALVCDVDGTLAPIVTRPDEASVPDSTREVLVELNRRYALVACLSGRRAVDARRIVGVEALTYIGNHGLERLPPGAQEPETVPEVSSHVPAVSSFAAAAYTPELRRAGIRIEDKQSIWSFHWREAPDEASAREALERIAKSASEKGFVPHWGRKVLEIRPPVAVDKGTAIEKLLRHADLEAAMYGGDDRTDLDAFRRLRELRSNGGLEHSVCVGVRSGEGPVDIILEADLVVEGPSGFRQLLARL